MHPIEIRLLPDATSTNTIVMEQITNMVNRVYTAAEEGLWTNGAVRTNTGEVTDITHAGEMAVAQINRRIVGCVRIRRLDQETGEFGMLAVETEYRGTGIGRELISFAEQKCRQEQLHTMQLELLVPQIGSHPSKTFLANWYSRIGYFPICTETIDKVYPALAPLLAIPCNFVIYQKELGQ